MSTKDAEPVVTYFPAPYRDSLCRINRLPLEMLCHVFILGAEIEIDTGCSSKNKAEGIALGWRLLITRVCRLWRSAAIQTASCWTSINFEDELPSDKHKTYLQRSRNAPLDICITDSVIVSDWEYMFSKEEDPSIARMRAVLDLLVPHVARWRSLKVNLRNYELMTLTLQKLCDCLSAPLLERLVLSYVEILHIEERNKESEREKLLVFWPPGTVLFHGRAPSLKEALLNGVPLNWSQCGFLSGLTVLELEDQGSYVRPSFDELTDIIRRCPDLSRLVISTSEPAWVPEHWKQEPLPLPRLKTLRLSRMLPQDAEQLIAQMVAPSLVQLQLDFVGVDCNSLISALSCAHPLMQHSVLSKLESLNIRGRLLCDEHTIKEAYKAMTSLRALQLSFAQLPREWYKALKQPRILPLLETLSIAGFGFGMDVCIKGHHLRALLRRRAAEGAPVLALRVARKFSVVTENGEPRVVYLDPGQFMAFEELEAEEKNGTRGGSEESQLEDSDDEGQTRAD